MKSIVMVRLELSMQDPVVRSSEGIQITNAHWTAPNPGYANEDNEKAMEDGKQNQVLFATHAFIYRTIYVLIGGIHSFQ